ncbi:Arginine/lysine/ornithine decarboxylase OS=Ureibacillus acetophenoni OX=614649 GN=SAMN05877842_1233 PE=3 SV=1 [Ureibacillus acetophenoni]
MAVSILKKEPIIRNVSDHTSFEIAKITMPENSFAQVEQNETEWIPYTRSIGRISAGMVIPYPPGIPLFVPGEKITVSRLSQLEELLMTGATFQGTHQLENKLILVIK